MGVSIHGGTPKWMVYKGKSENKMDDLRVPPFMDPPNDVSDDIIKRSDPRRRQLSASFWGRF